MEGEAVAAVLQVLVQNLIDHAKNEISLIRGLDKEAAKLTGSLDTIQKFLNDAEERTIPGEAVKSWLKKLEDVVFDADNVLDELNYHILSKQIKPKKAKVPSCFSCFNHISRSRNMALRIKEINENLESINKEAAELGLVERLANEPTLVNAGFETDSYTLDPIFIGRDDIGWEIVEMLTNSITTDERAVSIFPIVGMGGLGKTTLIRKVFNHLKDENRFRSHIWVHVSPNFEPLTLFKKILKELTKNQVETTSRQDILSMIQKDLKDKSYLLVLDDVWNRDASKWEDFMNSLLGVTSVKGNAIVVSTRSMEVASIVNPLLTHELKGLSEEECWSIIKLKAFGEGNVPTEFEEIGKKIASRCQGLPLAANVVGGVLRNQPEKKWRSIEEKWLSQDEGANISKILRLSFDNLSPPLLKKCFAYCAIFPKGSGIMKQELIELWMAEGFLQGDGRDDLESVGEKFINILLHNSLLQVSEGYDSVDVERCRMHDLVHDLACSVSSSSNNTGGSSRVRYTMTPGDENCGDISNPIPKEMAKSLRTLIFKGDISDINFSDFESLHVLGLAVFGVEELSSSIRKLIHLRYFDISNTWPCIECLPDWIGEFFHLQTLRAQNLRKVPSAIKYLINLRHLYINEDVELPAGIGRLTCLQTLKYFPVGDESGCKIEELGSLNDLKGELCIRNLERVHDKEEAGKANLFQKSKILKLCLEWRRYRVGERNDENVLDGLQPHSDLYELQIRGFTGKRFSLWTRKMAVRNAAQGSWMGLNKLTSLSLIECKECEEIPMLGQLPNLKSLVLSGWSNLKCINSSFYGMTSNETRIVFPSLKSFQLEDMPKLAEWTEIEVSGASEVKLFPRLQYLQIHRCSQLMSLPSLGHLPNLKSLDLVGLMNLKCINSSFQGMVNNDSRIVFPALEELILNEMPKLAKWAEIEASGASEVKLFPRLRYLRISRCSQLMSVPSLGHLPNLKSLMLWGLSNLKCINSSFYGMVNEDTRIVFPALEKLQLHLMPKLTEWAEVEVSGGSEVKLFPRLQHLEISHCEQLMSVPSHVSSCLQHLKIDGIGVECLPADWLFSNNQTLSYLSIEDCPNLRELRDRDNGGEQSQRSFTSLRHLEIDECEALEYLPCEMLGFSLEKLSLKSLSSLKNLPTVLDCLPKSPRLRNLSITGVPNFMANCYVETPRFSNLRDVNLDVSTSSMEAVDDILRGCCHSLNKLTLVGMESCECLPESIQHLSAVSKLELHNFGMEELPAWFGNLSSLQELSIRGCPELVIQSEAVDYELPNVSHIPTIYIDGSIYIAGDRK